MAIEKIQLLEITSELGSSTRGTSLGSEAIQKVALAQQHSLFSQYPILTIPHQNALLSTPSPYPFAQYLDSIQKVYGEVIKTTSNYLIEERFIALLSGDHSTAGATIGALRQAFPYKRLGVVWIDAQANLHTPYTTLSGNLNEMPLATALALDNQEQKRNAVDDTTKVYWNQLKDAGGLTPKIRPEELVYIGLGDISAAEAFIIEKRNIRHFSAAEVHERNSNAVANETLSYLANCEMIYVSLDANSLNLQNAGTSTNTGLSPEEASELIAALVRDPRCCCLEIAEVNPTLGEQGNLVAEIAFSILEQALEVVEVRIEGEKMFNAMNTNQLD